MDSGLTMLQAELCRKHGSPVVVTLSSHKVGIADGVGKVPGIINGLRHPAPGWRFLIDERNGYEDVWFDPKLLEV